jgi:hypothetical protein
LQFDAKRKRIKSKSPENRGIVGKHRKGDNEEKRSKSREVSSRSPKNERLIRKGRDSRYNKTNNNRYERKRSESDRE